MSGDGLSPRLSHSPRMLEGLQQGLPRPADPLSTPSRRGTLHTVEGRS